MAVMAVRVLLLKLDYFVQIKKGLVLKCASLFLSRSHQNGSYGSYKSVQDYSCQGQIRMAVMTVRKREKIKISLAENDS